ncbi:MAG: hypothetical protein JRH15_11945, partial [Deltaproteobacteria bacterium]|nr:hypothetical protein [Deltaproteobacteria bacterium]
MSQFINLGEKWIDSKIMAWIGIVALIGVLVLPAAAFGINPTSPAQNSSAKWNFNTFMQHALVHSPHLTKTAVQFKIRRMDEDDSRAEMLPAVTLHTAHYVSEGTSIGVSANTYHPLASYYSLKARRIITEIAKLKHVMALAEAHYTVAQQFFRF